MCSLGLSIIRMSLFVILSLHSINASSINFSSTHLMLNCDSRGKIDVLFHVYGHVQETWDGNFEVGSGHKHSKGYDIVSFRNGDVLFHNIYSDTYSYHYYDDDRILYSCTKISERSTYPFNLEKVS